MAERSLGSALLEGMREGSGAAVSTESNALESMSGSALATITEELAFQLMRMISSTQPIGVCANCVAAHSASSTAVLLARCQLVPCSIAGGVPRQSSCSVVLTDQPSSFPCRSSIYIVSLCRTHPPSGLDAPFALALDSDHSCSNLSPLGSFDPELAAPVVITTSGSSSGSDGTSFVHLRECTLLKRAHWAADAMGLNAGAVVAVRTQSGFIDAVNELFSALLARCSLLGIPSPLLADPASLSSRLDHGNASHFASCPSVLLPLASTTKLSLRYVLSSGEPLHRSAASVIAKALLNESEETFLLNTYGLTECCGDSTALICTRKDAIEHAAQATSGLVPVGMPLPGCRISIDTGCGPSQLSRDANRAGVVYICGEEWMPQLVCDGGGQRVSSSGAYWRTGDRGWITAKGELVVAGRSEDSTSSNVHGKRISPGTIRSALSNVRGIDQVAVKLPSKPEDRKTITVFIVLDSSSCLSSEDKASVMRNARRAVQASCGGEAVSVRAVQSLPLTPSGKVDIERLEVQKSDETRKLGKCFSQTLHRVMHTLERCIGLELSFDPNEALKAEVGASSAALAAAAAELGIPVEVFLQDDITAEEIARHCVSDGDNVQSTSDHVDAAKVEYAIKFDGCVDASVSLAFEGRYAIVGSHGGDLRCFETQSGEQLWRTDHESRIRSPTCVSERLGAVFVGSEDCLVRSLSLHSGSTLWRIKLSDAVRAAPTLDCEAEHLYALSDAGGVHCLTASTGYEVSTIQLASCKPIVSKACLARNAGLLIVASLAGEIVAFCTKSYFLAAHWKQNIDGPVFSPPQLLGIRWIAVASTNACYCLSLDDGSQHWCVPLPTAVFSRFRIYRQRWLILPVGGKLLCIDSNYGHDTNDATELLSASEGGSFAEPELIEWSSHDGIFLAESTGRLSYHHITYSKFLQAPQLESGDVAHLGAQVFAKPVHAGSKRFLVSTRSDSVFCIGYT